MIILIIFMFAERQLNVVGPLTMAEFCQILSAAVAEILRRVRLSIRARGVLHILNFAIFEANNSALLFFNIYASLGPLSSDPGSLKAILFWN